MKILLSRYYIRLILLVTGSLYAMEKEIARESSNEAELIEACEKLKIDRAKELLSRGVTANCSDQKAKTPLHYAANGHDARNLELIGLLMSHGANIRAVDSHGNTPLHIASGHQYIRIRDFIENGADKIIYSLLGADPMPNNITRDERDEKIVRCLLEHGSDVNAKSRKAWFFVTFLPGADVAYTPLHRASWNGRLRSAKTLLEHGARIEDTDSYYGYTALLWANCYERWEVAAFLVAQGANIHVRDANNNSVLHYACVSGNLAYITAVMQRGGRRHVEMANNSGETPLLVACRLGHLNVVRFLLELGANIDIVDNFYNTALINCCLRGNRDLIDCVWQAMQRKRQTLTSFLSYFSAKKFDVNYCNKDGKTPLIRACELSLNSLDRVRYLLELRADPNIADSEKETPLHYACKNGNVELVRVLLNASARVDVRNQRGSSPTDLAPMEVRTEMENLMRNYNKV